MSSEPNLKLSTTVDGKAITYPKMAEHNATIVSKIDGIEQAVRWMTWNKKEQSCIVESFKAISALSPTKPEFLPKFHKSFYKSCAKSTQPNEAPHGLIFNLLYCLFADDPDLTAARLRETRHEKTTIKDCDSPWRMLFMDLYQKIDRLPVPSGQGARNEIVQTVQWISNTSQTIGGSDMDSIPGQQQQPVSGRSVPTTDEEWNSLSETEQQWWEDNIDNVPLNKEQVAKIHKWIEEKRPSRPSPGVTGVFPSTNPSNTPMRYDSVRKNPRDYSIPINDKRADLPQLPPMN
jgi:hypothetical protein